MAWKYIPYTLYNSNSTYYNLRKILSYNCAINVIIGARGLGKTFSVKNFITKQFINKNQKFVWIRDTVDAKKELCDNEGSKFFEDFVLMKNPKFISGSIKKSEFIINEKHAGTCLPASVFQRYKGNSFQNIKNIVYDEFIREKGRISNKNNLWATINTFSTVARARNDVRIFLLGNALDKGDDFLQFLGVEIDDFGFYVNREKSVVLHYADNSSSFNEVNSKGIIGKLIIGSPLEDNLINSKFINSSNLTFDKLPAKSKLLFIIETPLQNARFYQADGKLYVTEDNNKDTYKNKRYVVDLINASRTKPALSLYHKKMIKENIDKNNVFFCNNYYHKFVLSLI